MSKLKKLINKLKELKRIHIDRKIYPSLYKKDEYVDFWEHMGELNGKSIERHNTFVNQVNEMIK